MKRVLMGTCALAVGLAVASAVSAGQTAKKPSGKVLAHFTTSAGNFTVELFEKDAPKTVANFIGLAEGTKEWTDPKTETKVKKPYYNGLVFHRVIKNFMIQGGDPLGNGTGGPGYSFADEFGSGRKLDKAGILAMANRGPNTNGGQFFITLAPTEWLTGKHTVFGEVVDGMDVVKKIGVTPTKPGDVPVTPITIQSVKIERT
jgi:peptidyl-prolyl cis-trans isomerase A (cyclophilin A)